MSLHHKDSVVPVAHQTRQIVAFGMNQPEDIGQFRIGNLTIWIQVVEKTEALTVSDSRGETLTKEIVVNLRGIKTEHLADNALILIVSCGHPLTAGVDNINEVTLLGLTHDAFDCTREYPRMTAEDGFLLARSYDKLRTLHCFMSWIVFCGFSLLKTALPATRTSAPASKSKGAFCRLTPPSTSMRH